MPMDTGDEGRRFWRCMCGSGGIDDRRIFPTEPGPGATFGFGPRRTRRDVTASLVSLLTVLVLCTGACDPTVETGSSTTDLGLRMAVTTSTRDSGLLDRLVPLFESRHESKVLIIASGTGKAMRLGENGDVDLVFVHARTAEKAFMATGHGVRHEAVMRNYFTVLGPSDDPAGIRGMAASHALTAIATSGAFFVSRGDDSGTHKREMALWSQAGHSPQWAGYIESGRGMGVTLVMANEKQAYVLTDMGTYLAFIDKIQLEPLLDEQEALHNPYGILVVNPAKHVNINRDLADKFVDFIISPEAQQIIGTYQVGGRTLFRPRRVTTEH